MVISFESRKKSYPAFVLVLGYAAFSILFKDRWNYCSGILFSLLLFLGCYGLGKRLSFLIFKIADQTLYFPLGLGTTLAVSFAAASFTTTPLLFYCIWGALALFSIFELPVMNYRIGRTYFWAAPFVLFAFWRALTPTTSLEALSNQLGLAHQYLANGKDLIIPGNLFSSFPPFSTVLNLLFAGVHMESGIKPFLILIYFQIISIVVGLLRWLITEPAMSFQNDRSEEYQVDLLYMSRMEFLVIPMLLFPSAWIAIDMLSPAILAALFFCAGVSTLVKEFDFLTFRKLLNSSVLLSFSLWTEYSMLLYVILLPLLWFSLSGWRLSRENLKSLGALLLVTLALWSPFLVRNSLVLGDPFYPMLAGIRPDPDWTPQQTLALDHDVMKREGAGFGEILMTPFRLMIQPDVYGPAAAIGLIPILSLILYPLVRRFRTVNRILLYCLFSYLAWLYVFRRFLELFPAFLFLFLASYFAFRYLYLRSRKWLALAWCGGAIVSAYFLYLSGVQTPLILPGQTESQYLRQYVDTFAVAERLNLQMEGKTLLLGESRIAFFQRPLLAVSPYDQMSLFQTLAQANNSQGVVEAFRKSGIRFVVFNPVDLRKFSETKGVWKFSDSSIRTISDALRSSAQMRQHSGDVTLFEIKDTTW